MNRNLKIAAAVAAALGSGAALAAGPTITDINNTPDANTVYIAGSSAIKNALTNSILNNFCGGSSNATVVTSNGTNTNFLGVACTPTGGAASHGGNYNVWIRFEGGSVTGILPVVNVKTVNQIDGPTLSANPITVNGSSGTNGTGDTFSVSAGGSLSKHAVDLGIADVEPKALTGNNYPSDYSLTVWGPINNNGMFNAVATGTIIDEVYALYVNETGGTFTENPMSLSKETAAAILTGQITDWSQVFDNANPPKAVVNASTPIVVVNREYGSGSRAATDILIAGDKCASAGVATTLIPQKAKPRYFATGDVLKAANSVPGAITYATIDNTPGAGGSNQSNLSWVSLDGVVPSSLGAAEGTYPFWVEATYINNTTTTGHDSLAVNSIVAALQNQNTTAAIADVMAIPSLTDALGNAVNATVHINPVLGGLVPSGGGTATVYINPFTRGGVTCNNPAYAATQTP
jgi:ABC-type phosphate transport system substrate-binding protein